MNADERQAERRSATVAIELAISRTSTLGQSQSIPPLIKAVVMADTALRLSVLDSMSDKYGSIGPVKEGGTLFARRAFRELQPLRARVPRLRTAIVTRFLSNYVSRLPELSEAFTADLLALAEAARLELPAGASRTLAATVESHSLLLRAHRDALQGRPVGCDLVERWSTAQRQLVDAGQWTLSAASDGALDTYFFARVAMSNGQRVARACLTRFGYDYERLLNEALTADERSKLRP